MTKEYYRSVIKISRLGDNVLAGYVVCRNRKEEQEVMEKARKAGFDFEMLLNENMLVMSAKMYLDEYVVG